MLFPLRAAAVPVRLSAVKLSFFFPATYTCWWLTLPTAPTIATHTLSNLGSPEFTTLSHESHFISAIWQLDVVCISLGLSSARLAFSVLFGLHLKNLSRSNQFSRCFPPDLADELSIENGVSWVLGSSVRWRQLGAACAGR